MRASGLEPSLDNAIYVAIKGKSSVLFLRAAEVSGRDVNPTRRSKQAENIQRAFSRLGYHRRYRHQLLIVTLLRKCTL